jgi:glycosyltransferase involved in cell wall biosynthesis
MALHVFVKLLKRERIHRRTLLLLLGNHGPETTTIKAVIKREALEDSVKLIDGVSDEELIWLYKSCDILLAPSLMEGFGLPIVEGLLCGSRVVCSDIPTFREVGGEACYYFDLYSEKGSSSLATAICDALTKPKREGEDLERFSLEEIARNLMTVYLGLKESSIRETNRSKTVALHPVGS